MAESVGLRWYTTGTVKVTQNSTALTGTSTVWEQAGIKPGDIFTIDRSVFYEIASVNSDTSITLGQAYAGATNNTANYYIIRNFAATLQSELAAEVSRQNAIYQTWMDGRVTEVGIEYQYYKQYKGTWASGAAYKPLDIVMYNTALYVCTVAHTSSSSIIPTNTAYWTSYAPAMPSSIDVLNYNNAGSHNAFYREKTLTWNENLSAVIKAGTFIDIYPGDRFTFNNVAYTYEDEEGSQQSATYSGTWVVGGLDYRLRCGGAIDLTTHHLAVFPLTQLYAAQMNPTNTTEGGYMGSKMYTTHLKRAEAIVKACFGASHVIPYNILLTNAVTNGRASAGAWVTRNIDLMSEPMVYGCYHFESGSTDGGTTIPYRYTIDKSQLPAFQHNHALITSRNQWWWLRDVVSPSYFANVNNDGYSAVRSASLSSGVRPLALIA